MKKYNNTFEITEETVAAWLDRNLPAEEDATFVELLSSNPQLAEILDSFDEIESDFENLIEEGYEIPAELSFDFQLPNIDILSDNDHLLSTFNNNFDYSDVLDSDNIQETEESESDMNECADDLDDVESENLDIWG